VKLHTGICLDTYIFRQVFSTGGAKVYFIKPNNINTKIRLGKSNSIPEKIQCKDEDNDAKAIEEYIKESTECFVR
jgi:hypothetical protein